MTGHSMPRGACASWAYTWASVAFCFTSSATRSLSLKRAATPLQCAAVSVCGESHSMGVASEGCKLAEQERSQHTWWELGYAGGQWERLSRSGGGLPCCAGSCSAALRLYAAGCVVELYVCAQLLHSGQGWRPGHVAAINSYDAYYFQSVLSPSISRHHAVQAALTSNQHAP
jgi:hypothetical protein